MTDQETRSTLTPTLDSLLKAQNCLPLQALFYTGGIASHLDLGSNDGRTLRGLDKSRITCVELFGPSVAALRGEGFNNVYPQDIRTFVERAIESFSHDGTRIWDRITAFDVIEHLPKQDGLKLLEQIEQIAAKEIILFMPIETPELEATEQWRRFRDEGLAMHPDGQRELHRHLSRWAPKELQDRGYFTLVLPNFHYDGFGAFFAAKYRDPAVQAAVVERVQRWAAQQGLRIDRPLLILGRQYMDIDPSVMIGFGARLEAIDSYAGQTYQPRLSIGANTTAEYFLHVGCVERVEIGRDCLIAGHCTIVDHDHGFAADRPLHGQPLTVAPVKIGDSVFLGEGCFVGKGVTIGDRAVVGAGAVVVRDVPAGAVMAGVPARVIGSVPGSRLPTMDESRPYIQHSYHGPAYKPGSPLVSIIVPTCGAGSGNGNLWAVERHTPEAHEIIIVNNGSQNWTLAQWGYRENVTIIHNQENLGFARAVNQGIVAAKGDYVLILNDDVTIGPDWLSSMLAIMRAHPEVGLVGPMSDNVSGKQQGQAVVGAAPLVVTRLVGFCLLVRRTVIDKIGGLDETLLNAFEDDDFCLRAKAAGFQAAIARDAFVHHEGQQTFRTLGLDYQATMTAAWEVFRQKWGAEGGGPATGTYSVQIPEFDPAKHYVALPT